LVFFLKTGFLGGEVKWGMLHFRGSLFICWKFSDCWIRNLLGCYNCLTKCPVIWLGEGIPSYLYGFSGMKWLTVYCHCKSIVDSFGVNRSFHWS